MKRHAWILGLALVAGCGASAGIEHADIVADLACETAYVATRLAAEIPPAPQGDACENCDGTGKLGDGRITTTCPICKGTGKRPPSVLVKPCTSGSCRP